MSRAQRLLSLLQLLRSHRFPVAGSELAVQLGVSLRTLYRDIATLQAQGADIEGEAGVGYVLRPGFMLPPLMFSEEELEALMLGMRWVAERTDASLGHGARGALQKIAAVLPVELKETLDAHTLLVGPGQQIEDRIDVAHMRALIRSGFKAEIHYEDVDGKPSQRTIWPFAIGYFERVRILVAWCELRQAFRHFRTDRILWLSATDQRYPRRRQQLLREWRQANNIPPQPLHTADKN